jgi:2-oxoglutarate ferredoxin oxidoreductase subunit beta
VTVGEYGVTEARLMVHDETNPVLAQMLLRLEAPLPSAMGVIHRRTAPTYDSTFSTEKPTRRRVRVKQLLHRGNVLDRC